MKGGISFWEKATSWLRGRLWTVRRKKAAGSRLLSQRLYWVHGGDQGLMQFSSTLEGSTGKDMDYPDYWLMKGETMLQQERLAEASYCFDLALRHDAADAYALINKGYCLYRLGSYEAALASLNQASSLDPDHPGVNMVRALCLCSLQRFEEALTCFTSAIRRGLETPAIWNNKGFCLSRLGRHREASAAFRIALNKCDEESPEILCNAAAVMVDLGTHERALEYFNKALGSSPGDHILYNNRAICLELLGQYDRALECYKRALAIDPNNAAYLYNMGICQLKLHLWDQAVTCLREAVSQEPDNALAWCGIAAACLAKGLTEEALACYNQALATTG
jgi:tetratricopeptide (TPR) repeat protein